MKAAEREASTRKDVAVHLQGLVLTLQTFQLFLQELDIEPAGVNTAPAPAAPPSAPNNLFAGDDDDLLAAPPALIPATASPTSAAESSPVEASTLGNIVDDFDAFLKEDIDANFATT